MTFTQNEDGSFAVVGKSGNWLVNKEVTNCNCPKFRFILKGQGPCHHMTEILQRQSHSFASSFNPNDYKTELSEDEFAKKYGEEQLTYLKRTGEVYVIKNTVKVLS
jgi:predicted nucleic acid-binding Zn finger protein